MAELRLSLFDPEQPLDAVELELQQKQQWCCYAPSIA